MSETPVDRPTPLPGQAQPLARELNDAGFAMFRAVGGGQNLAISPASIGLAFGMLKAGASGPVDASLQELFGFSGTGEALLSQFNSLEQGLTSEADDDSATVRIANRMFVDDDFTPLQAYSRALGTYFGAGVQREPLQREPEHSRDVIDGWVSDRTEGLIPNVMPDDLPNDSTQMVLVNTVYMKAMWESPFDANYTGEQEFYPAEGPATSVDMMNGSLSGSFAVTDDYAAVVMPYVGDLDMVLVVPSEDHFDEVQARLSQSFLDELDAGWRSGHVAISLPRFDSTAKVNLEDVIEGGLGVQGLFHTEGLDGIGPNLALDAAVHATKVIVDEEGTEAAAATVLGIMLTGMPMYDAEITADRPFLYVIRDTETGAVLFVGRYVAPE